jgi:hypothetical protein
MNQLSKTKLNKKIRIAKILLSNNIQNAKDGFYIQNYHNGIFKDNANLVKTCIKKSCNGELVYNKTGECILLWKNNGTGEPRPTTSKTCYYCNTCYKDQSGENIVETITKSINENIMNDSSIGESQIIQDMKFVYFLLEKLNQIEEKNTNFNAEKTDILEHEIDSFCNRLKTQNETIYKVFDNNKILNFDEIEKQLMISKIRNTELSNLLKEILTYDNLILLSNELQFNETHERQNATNITNFKLVKVYAEPKDLNKLNSQKLDDSMKSDSTVDLIFQSNSELLSQTRYDENFKRIVQKEILKERMVNGENRLNQIVAEKQLERMEFEECL